MNVVNSKEIKKMIHSSYHIFLLVGTVLLANVETTSVTVSTSAQPNATTESLMSQSPVTENSTISVEPSKTVGLADSSMLTQSQNNATESSSSLNNAMTQSSEPVVPATMSQSVSLENVQTSSSTVDIQPSIPNVGNQDTSTAIKSAVFPTTAANPEATALTSRPEMISTSVDTAEESMSSVASSRIAEQLMSGTFTTQTAEQSMSGTSGIQTAEQSMSGAVSTQAAVHPTSGTFGIQTAEQSTSGPVGTQAAEQLMSGTPTTQTVEQSMSATPGTQTAEQSTSRAANTQTAEQSTSKPTPSNTSARVMSTASVTGGGTCHKCHYNVDSGHCDQTTTVKCGTNETNCLDYHVKYKNDTTIKGKRCGEPRHCNDKKICSQIFNSTGSVKECEITCCTGEKCNKVFPSKASCFVFHLPLALVLFASVLLFV